MEKPHKRKSASKRDRRLFLIPENEDDVKKEYTKATPNEFSDAKKT